MSEEFESPLDKVIREAREKGEFDQLPGKGSPIRWEDESMVPEAERMANRLLKNNNFTLNWIALAQELDAEYEGLRTTLQHAHNDYATGKIDSSAWQRAIETFRESVKALNKRLIGYNLRTPNEHFHRRPYSASIED